MNELAPTRRFAIGRLIGLLVAIAGIGGSIFLARKALKLNAEYHNWVSARPMQSAVDLSTPGELTVPFHQTCSTSHGETLYFSCECTDGKDDGPEARLRDLAATFVIRDAQGEVVEQVEINESTISVWNGRVQLAGFLPFRRGAYTATLTVKEGAPALAGCRQSLHAEYQLCGLEAMPAVIMAAFSAGSGLIGLIAALSVLPRLIHHGLQSVDELKQRETPERPTFP
jgi:hypothetical protein